MVFLRSLGIANVAATSAVIVVNDVVVLCGSGVVVKNL